MKIANWKSSLVIAAIIATQAATTWAATCSVPSAGYPTIQAAVDDPTCTTVSVAPGVYTENVSVPRALTLNGAQAGQPVGGRISGGPGESTVVGANPAGGNPVFAINAPSVTIDGFTIKNSVTTGAATGIQVKPGSNDAVIFNSFIDGIETADLGPAGRAQGIYLQNGLVNVNVGNNTIRNITSNGTATGILFGDNDTNPGIDISFVHDNTIAAVTSATEGASAVICLKASSNATAFFFRTNHISNLSGGGWAHAVSLESDTVDALVLENDFSTLTSLSGDVVAIWINNDPNAYTTDGSGNVFDLPASAYGVKIQGVTTFPPPMNAGCNWWGSPDGPGPVGTGHGCQVSPHVAYSPWRVTPTHDTAACVGNNVPTTDGQCKNGGWITLVRPDGSIFKSQGDCIQFVNNGR
jgi:hypothetical protein